MFNLTKILRTYQGLTQTQLCKRVALSQPDLCELEGKNEPFGAIAKYRRLADYFGVPVDALLRNDFRAVPEDFFRRSPEPVYQPVADTSEARIGRAGEDFILDRERERLSERFPNLARLVLPYYKIPVQSPGFDILSFDDEGHPFAVEVKTSVLDAITFRLTNNEFSAAKKLTEAGFSYKIAFVTNFETGEPTVENVDFDALQQQYNVRPSSYTCRKKVSNQTITGLSFYRKRVGLKQGEMADRLGIPACNLSIIESGARMMGAALYLKASEILGVPVDALLETYTSDDPEACHV